MTDDEAFWTLYSGLDREGPGLRADVEWAVGRLELQGALEVCDAACGSGADTVALAELLPEAKIEAVELGAALVAAAQERCRGLKNVSVRQGDMMEIEGPCDLIWCAGALYFAGITEGLSKWRRVLAPGGSVVFSEPVRLAGERAATEIAFWDEYPALTDMDGIVERVHAADFRVLDTRLIVGDPWAFYYRSMKARIDELERGPVPAALGRVLEAAKAEMANWTAAQDRIAYALMITQPA